MKSTLAILAILVSTSVYAYYDNCTVVVIKGKACQVCCNKWGLCETTCN